MGAVALREERQSLTIDSPEAIADLCSEMRVLDHEWLVLFFSTPNNISSEFARLVKVPSMSPSPTHEKSLSR